MTSIEEKQEQILAHEQGFARRLASELIVKPELSLWMILIPIFFVFFFFRLNKVKTGREEFVRNFMITRRNTLEETYDAIREERKPNLGKLCEITDAPAETHPVYRDWVKVLSAHYLRLIQSGGSDFEEMVKAAYKSRKSYLLFLNRLNQAEKTFNRVLSQHIKDADEGVGEVIREMEKHSEKLRRDDAERLFH